MELRANGCFTTRATRQNLCKYPLNSWANTFSKITGKDFYFHCLRHFFATKLSESGLPDSVIQSIVGWESADMVRVYVDTSVDDVIGQYFNEVGIKKDIEQVGLSDL